MPYQPKICQNFSENSFILETYVEPHQTLHVVYGVKCVGNRLKFLGGTLRKILYPQKPRYEFRRKFTDNS